MAIPKRLAVIITALPIERQAVLEQLSDVREEPPLRGSIYRRGVFSDGPDSWEIVVAEIGAGNEGAAAEAERLLGHYNPQVALFVGIAGALKDLSLGDVVASTKIYNYEAGKDAAASFQTRPETELSAHALLSRARHEAGENDWLNRVRWPDPSVPRPASAKAIVGPIAAGPKVLASTRSATFAFIREHYGDAVAVEMEGFGFLRSVRMNHPVQGIVVRGISDCVGDKAPEHDQNWQPIAARHAAAFAFQILAKLGDASGVHATSGSKGAGRNDVQSLQSYWREISSIAEHLLAESVFTTSREAEIVAVTKWLSGTASSLFMRTNGLADGVDFLAALGSRGELEKLQRALIVYTAEAWRDLLTNPEPLLLIAAPTLELRASDIAGAVEGGHFVFLSGPRANTAGGPAETLRRQDYYSIKGALVASGFSESQALKFSQACCGSSSILKRLITRHPETDFPPWCREEIRATVAPFALVGGWTHVDPPSQPQDPNVAMIGSPPPIDMWVVTELVGCTRDDLEARVVRWQLGMEPLFVRFGRSVLVASREDAWHLLGGAISAEQVKRFEGFAQLVLDEDNPAFQLDRDQRWMANILGKTHSLSEDLRRSIVETLVLMATYQTADGPVPGVDLKRTIRSVLDRVLPANAPWQRWASFGRNLPVVAEADPEFFLGRVELDLRSPGPELPKLFQDQSHSVFGGAIHSDLLWALEGLAWTPEYLSRVAVCLAKLASRDPGGTYANRPANSLREIFLWWLWHTNASLEDRMKAIVDVLRVEPNSGWSLLKNLLPSGTSGISHETHMPRWRPWADGWSREKLRPQTNTYAIAIAELTIQTAALDGQRWSEVLDGMLRFSSEITARVFSVLEKICDSKGTLNPEEIFALWNAMSRLVSRHERYRDAPWVFDQTTRDRLSEMCRRLEPTEAVLKHQWLFSHRAQLRGFDPVKDHVAQETALHEARLNALKQIVVESGANGIFRLLDLAADASMVGWIVGGGNLLGIAEIQLPTVLDDPGNRRLGFASAYIRSRFNVDGWTFIDQFPVAEWSPLQIAIFAMCLPFRDDVWQWLRRFGTEAEQDYWRRVNGFLRDPTLAELQIATASLIAVGRGANAIDVLQHSAATNKLSLPGEFIADVLEKALAALGSEERSITGDFSYSAQQLIKQLQQGGDPDRTRLARIEWGYLPLLDSDFGEVGPKTLVDVISSEPSFYVDLVKIVFRGEHDKPGDLAMNEQEQLKGQQASRLLEKLSRLPGTRDDGTVDWSYLSDWLRAVQTMAASNDRRAICDLTLGQFIARASIRSETNWPSPELSTLSEEIGSDDFFRGFVNGVLNSRGVTSRDPAAGGEQERQLVERYTRLANNTRDNCPKLADAFLELAGHYEAYAKHEDDEAQRLRIGKF